MDGEEGYDGERDAMLHMEMKFIEIKREAGKREGRRDGKKRGEEEIIYQYEKWRESRCGVSVEEEKKTTTIIPKK